MSMKHLATGAALPPLQENTLRLYSMRFCPFAQRTRLVLEHKHLTYETVNVNLMRKPEWLFEKNPIGKVPILEINDKVVYESAICDEFLDEFYPDLPLFPKDPYARARIKVLMEHYSQVVPKFYALAKVSEEEKTTIYLEMQVLLDMFEKELNGKKYFGGEGPDMLDYHMWPWFERISNIEKLLPKDKLPHLLAWTDSMLNTAAVKAVAETVKTHQAFIDSWKTKNVDYDMEPLSP